jgi:pimeloyl-ACP methyl ester carboxylesterase
LLFGLLLLAALYVTVPIAQAALNFTTQSFQSEIDKKEDNYAFLLPSNKSFLGTSVLVVYLHKLNETYTAPFVGKTGKTLAEAIQKEFPTVSILSLNYGGKDSWGRRQARIDITHNIHDFIATHPTDKIVLMGEDMGGTTAINYYACAPKDLKEKICGVVAVSAVSDLAELYRQTAGGEVKSTMEKAFGGKPAAPHKEYLVSENEKIKQVASDYFNNSLEANWPLFPTDGKVALVTANLDAVNSVQLQRNLARSLRNRDITLKEIEVQGEAPAITNSDLVEGLKFVLK